MINTHSLHSSDPNDLPELLTRPLADNAELRLFVQADLEQRLATATPGPRNDTAEQALSVLQRNSPRRLGMGKMRVAAWLVLLMWCLAALAAQAPDYILNEAVLFTKGTPETPFWFSQVRPSGLSHLHSLRRNVPFVFPFGMEPQDQLTALSGLREENPDSPGYYAVYAMEYWKQNLALPPDFEEVTARLDPENAFWLLMQSIDLGNRASVSNRTRRNSTVGDPVVFREAMRMLEKSSRQPRYDDYIEFQEKKIHAALTGLKTAGEVSYGEDLVMRGVRRIWPDPFIRIGLTHLRGEADIEGLRLLSESGRRLVLLTDLAGAEEPGYQAMREIQMSSPPDEKVQWKKLREAEGEVDSVKQTSGEAPESLGSHWLDLSKLAQARFIVAARAETTLTAIICLASAGVLGLLQLPGGNASGRFAKCVRPLLDRKGGVRLILQGVILPCLWCLSWVALLPTYDTPFNSLFVYVTGTLLIAVLISSVQVSRHEISRRLGFLDFSMGKWSLWIGRIMVISALLAPLWFWLPVFGRETRRPGLHGVGIAFSGVSLLWLLISLVGSFFTRQGQLLRRLHAWKLIPAMLALTTVLLFGTSVLFIVERIILVDYFTHSEASPDEAAGMRHRKALLLLQAEWQAEDFGP